MDTTAPRFVGEGPTPDALGDLAKLSAQVVAHEYPRQWADSGLPDSLATLDTPLETVWAAVQLALSGADLHTLASTLGLTADTASLIIIATTEQLISGPATSHNTTAEDIDNAAPPAPTTTRETT